MTKQPVDDLRNSPIYSQSGPSENDDTRPSTPERAQNEGQMTTPKRSQGDIGHFIAEKPSTASLRQHTVSTPLMLPQSMNFPSPSSQGTSTLAGGIGYGETGGLRSTNSTDRLDRIYTGSTTACGTMFDNGIGTAATANVYDGTKYVSGTYVGKYEASVIRGKKEHIFGQDPDSRATTANGSDASPHIQKRSSRIASFFTGKRKRKARVPSDVNDTGDEENAIQLDDFISEGGLLRDNGAVADIETSIQRRQSHRRRIWNSSSDSIGGGDLPFIKRFYRWLIMGGGLQNQDTQQETKASESSRPAAWRNYQKYPSDSLLFLFGGRFLSAKDTPLNVIIFCAILILGGLCFGFV